MRTALLPGPDPLACEPPSTLAPCRFPKTRSPPVGPRMKRRISTERSWPSRHNLAMRDLWRFSKYANGYRNSRLKREVPRTELHAKSPTGLTGPVLGHALPCLPLRSSLAAVAAAGLVVGVTSRCHALHGSAPRPRFKHAALGGFECFKGF